MIDLTGLQDFSGLTGIPLLLLKQDGHWIKHDTNLQSSEEVPYEML